MSLRRYVFRDKAYPAENMLIPRKIICLFFLTISLVNSKQTDGPEAIKITYEKVLSDPGGKFFNFTKK